MARKKVSPTDNSYAGPRWQQFFPDVYARNSDNFQTRTGRRNREQTTFANLLGLNTAFDDLHKSDGESPYLRNVRYMGERQTYQRAQVTSRDGAKLISVYGEEDHFVNQADGETYLELYEGRAIRFEVPHEDTLTRLQLFVNNYEGAKGRIRVLFKNSKNEEPLCDANIDLEEMLNKKWVERIVRPIIPLQQKNDDGVAIIQLEIMDDVEPDEINQLYPSRGRKVRILAKGNGRHERAEFVMPSQEEPWNEHGMREIPLTFTEEVNIPLVGYSTSKHTTMPRSSQTICTKDGKFIVYPVKENSTTPVLVRTNVDTGETVKIEASVDPKATAVRFAQGKDKIYYVDGYSDLQRIDTFTWKSEVAITTQDMIDADSTSPEDLKAKKGASLILKLRNRLYLSGFADDPNFVQFSVINTKGDGVQYDQYNEYFYSPDRSYKESTCGPITALEEYNGTIIVFRRDGSSAFSAPMGLEFGSGSSSPTQVDTFAFNIGIDRQEDVTNANGNLFFYNKSEGLRRYSGADATFQSAKVDNELRNIPDDSNRFMFAHGNKVRFYFDRDARGYADHNLLYHTYLAQSSPWYMDNQTPIMWAVGDQNTDTMYGMHSLYPALYIIDSPDTQEDFDSSIPMEYDTMYKSSGEIMGWTLVRRVEVSVIANDTNSWFIGVDKDHSSDPAVFRKWVKGSEIVPNGPDAVYPDTDSYSNQVVHITMRMKCRQFNVRTKVLTWKSNALLLAIIAECGVIQPR